MSLWFDGNNYLGELENVKLPDVETITKEFRGGGAAGDIAVPVGTKLSQTEFTVRKYDDKLYLTYGLLPGKPVDIAIRAAFQQDDQTSNLVATVRGTWNKLPGGELKAGEFSDQTFMLDTHVYILAINDIPCIQVDLPSGIVKVGTKDVLDEMRSLIGGVDMNGTELKLQYPIEKDGVTIDTLTLRRPTVGDIEAMEYGKNAIDRSIIMLANVTGQHKDIIRLLDATDMESASVVLEGFNEKKPHPPNLKQWWTT